MEELRIFRGDVVWAEISNAKGSQQKKGRPYLIISNNKANEHSQVLTAIPLTTKVKKNLPTHYRFFINGRENTLLAEQIAILNREDITSYVDTIDDKDLQEIEKRIKIQLDLKGE